MNILFKNRTIKYFLYFIFLFLFTYGFDYFFRPEHKDIIRTVSISFGFTAGMFIFTRKKRS